MSLQSFKSIVVGAALACMAAGSAASMPVTVNLGGGSNTLNTIMLSEGGLDITAEGFISFVSAANFGTPANINRNNAGNGWGVNNGGDGGLVGEGDTLSFDFGTNTVALLNFTLFENDGDQSAGDLFIDGVLADDFVLPAEPGTNSPFYDVSGLALSGSVFAFNGTENGFRVQSFTVELVPTEVPAPASLLLLGTGLAAFGAARRRRA